MHARFQLGPIHKVVSQSVIPFLTKHRNDKINFVCLFFQLPTCWPRAKTNPKGTIKCFKKSSKGVCLRLIYICKYFACLSVWVSVCLYPINVRQNDWTEPAQNDPREGLWMLKITKMSNSFYFLFLKMRVKNII